MENLEEVSYLLKGKNANLNPQDFLKMGISTPYAQGADDSCKDSTAGVINGTKDWFKVAEKKLDEEGKEVDEPVTPIGNMSDVINEAKVWEWAGVSFGEYELMLLHKSIKMHSLTAKADQVRLWGKIRGSERDYYVLEGTIGTGGGEEGAEEGGAPTDGGMEARGTGVNKYTYWVTNSPLDAWVMLPDLKPQDILNARQIKYIISGNIDNKIFTNPFYFDSEKTYLRA